MRAAASGGRAPLSGFGQLFLHEVDRANRSFAARRAELLEALRDPARRAELVGSIGGARHAEAVAATLTAQAAEAARLAITEVRVTFWLEPARRGVFEVIWGFLCCIFCCRKRESPRVMYRLAPAERRLHAAQFELTITSAGAGELAASEPRPLSFGGASTGMGLLP